MQQSKEEIEAWYQKEDPWQYKVTQADLDRRQKLYDILNKFAPYDRALDIGCGEGFVTEFLPAAEIHGIEISDLAASRFPPIVKRVHEPDRKYDLVMTTGTMYQQYDHAKMYDWIMNSATRIILIAGIKDWLLPYKYGKILYREEFQYREFTQQVTVYQYLGDDPRDTYGYKVELE